MEHELLGVEVVLKRQQNKLKSPTDSLRCMVTVERTAEQGLGCRSASSGSIATSRVASANEVEVKVLPE